MLQAYRDGLRPMQADGPTGTLVAVALSSMPPLPAPVTRHTVPETSPYRWFKKGKIQSVASRPMTSRTPRLLSSLHFSRDRALPPINASWSFDPLPQLKPGGDGGMVFCGSDGGTGSTPLGVGSDSGPWLPDDILKVIAAADHEKWKLPAVLSALRSCAAGWGDLQAREEFALAERSKSFSVALADAKYRLSLPTKTPEQLAAEERMRKEWERAKRREWS